MDTGASITNFLLYYIKEDLLYFYGKKFENLKYIKVCDFIKNRDQSEIRFRVKS